MNLRAQTTAAVLVVCIAAAILGGALLAHATVFGPTVHSDGVVYLLSADNLVAGDGFGITWGSGRFHPLAGYPPFYPLVVALFEVMGLDLVTAARVVGVAAFGLTILATGFLGYLATGSPGLGLSSSLLLLSSPNLFGQYASAGSEGVFYLTGLAGLTTVLLALRSGRQRFWVCAAILVGLGFLSRYVGLSLILTGCVCALLGGNRLLRRRIVNTGLFSGISLGLMVPWLAWAYSMTGTVGERSVHTIGEVWAYTEPFRGGLIDILWHWLPGVGGAEVTYRVRVLSLVAALLILSLGLVISLMAARRGHIDAHRVIPIARWSGVYLLFGAMYAMVHLAAYLATYPTPDVSERLFTPLYVSGAFASLGLVWIVPELRPSWRPLFAIPGLLTAALLITNARELGPLADSLHREGGGFTSKYWRSSLTVAAVGALPEDVPIISNAADALIFLTGRPTYWIPELMHGTKDPTFARFGDHPERSEEEYAFRYRGGALVVFPWIEGQLQQLYGDQARERLEALTRGLNAHWMAGGNEGIYFYPFENR